MTAILPLIINLCIFLHVARLCMVLNFLLVLLTVIFVSRCVVLSPIGHFFWLNA